MDKQKEDLQRHFDAEKKFLGEVILHESKERQEIKSALENFHKAVDERKKNIDAAFEQKRAEDLKALDIQAEELKKIVDAQDESAMIEFMKKINADKM